MELHTQRQIIALLQERGIHPSRGLGQNFLIDQNLLRFVAREAGLTRDDVVLDVGAGTGLLTRHLADSGAAVFAVEIDHRLFEICREYIQPYPNVTLLNKDVLKSKHEIDPELIECLRAAVSERRSGLKVVCNLPYAVSTPVLMDLLESGLPIRLLVITVQKEVGDRLAARPGSKAYGALSVVAQLHTDVRLLRALPPDVFWPRPKVFSAIMRLTPTDTRRRLVADYRVFRTVTHAVFAFRRKTLPNALAIASGKRLSSTAAAELLDGCGIDPARRGESLDLQEIIALANALGPVSA